MNKILRKICEKDFICTSDKIFFLLSTTYFLIDHQEYDPSWVTSIKANILRAFFFPAVHNVSLCKLGIHKGWSGRISTQFMKIFSDHLHVLSSMKKKASEFDKLLFLISEQDFNGCPTLHREFVVTSNYKNPQGRGEGSFLK